MGHTVETLSTLNSLIRTMLGIVIVGGVSWVGWRGYTIYEDRAGALGRKEAELADAQAELDSKVVELEQKDALIQQQDAVIVEKDGMIVAKDSEIVELNEEISEQEEEIQRLDTAIRLLKVDHRLAKLTVVKQETDPETDMVYTTIEFVETDQDGNPIDKPKIFRLKGDVVYVDYWVGKFDDKYVEEADILRSTSLCLFRRIFGERQQPTEGFALDEIGARPKAYSNGGKIGDFEKKIWDDFWNIANDADKARDLGIRAAHGEAVSTKLRPAKQYRLQLRASDGLSISPAEDAPPPAAGPAT